MDGASSPLLLFVFLIRVELDINWLAVREADTHPSSAGEGGWTDLRPRVIFVGLQRSTIS